MHKIYFYEEESKIGSLKIGCHSKTVRSPIVGKNISDQSILKFYSDVFKKYYNLNVTYIRYDDSPIAMAKSEIFDAIVFPARLLKIYEATDSTHIFFYDTYNWVLLKSSQIKSFKTLLFIFHLESLIIFVCFYFLMVVFWFLFVKVAGRKPRSSFLNIFKILIGHNIKVFSSTIQLKILLLCFHLYSICIICLFQARMASILAKPPLEKSVSNLQELLESSIVPLVDKTGNNSFKSSVIPIERQLGKKVRLDLPNFKSVDLTLDFIISNPNITAIVSNTQLLLFKQKSKKLKRLDNFSRKHESAFYFKKGHPLLKKVNRVLVAIFESGITRKWLSMMEEIVFESGGETKSLEVKHFTAAFFILFLGCGFGAVSFLLEISFCKLSQKNFFFRISLCKKLKGRK